MDVVAELERARESHRRQAWADACDAFGAIDDGHPLAAEDLDMLGEAADIVGRGDEAIRVMQRAYQAHVDSGTIGAAMRCAFWLCHALAYKGDFAHVGGWVARAERLTQTHPECPEQGYLLLLDAERHMSEGDHAAAFSIAGRAGGFATQCGDRDLVAVATHLQGYARVKAERLEEGMALLDEAMLGITAGETSPRVTGWIYCSTIALCHQLHEVRRAREWTTALNAWCDSLPQFTGAYSGICRVHRCQLLQLGGSWPEAVREAKLACDNLTQGYGEVVAGAAFYQLGEIHRLRGALADAEEAYRQASSYGWQTQPGLALLRLAQGKTDAAAAAIRRALTETSDRLGRTQLLPAYVEIMLATGTLEAAREGATELAEIAEAYDTPALNALSAHARGAVHLAGESPEAALPALRLAWRLWRDLDAPYEAACMRVLVGEACRALNDEDTAGMELDAARQVFTQLGASRDLARVDALSRKRPAGEASGLSPREVEVLQLVAAGKTNQAIAADLFLSEKTVHRHLSNIFAKLGVASRTAAAAYAFEHGIAGRAP